MAELQDVIAQGQQEKQGLEKMLQRRQDLVDEGVGRLEEMQTMLTSHHKRASFDTMKLLLASLKARKAHERLVPGWWGG